MTISFFNFVSKYEELMGVILWPYLQVNDIISLSMVSKEFENICIAINERVQQLINIREHGEYKALYMTPIYQIKSINRMLNIFPNITNITFSSSSKIYWEKKNFMTQTIGSIAILGYYRFCIVQNNYKKRYWYYHFP